MKTWLFYLIIILLPLLLPDFNFPEGSYDSGPAVKKSLHNIPEDTVEWQRPRFEERREDRHQLVKEIKRKGIDSPKVLEAMRHVPRHLFTPTLRQSDAYRDTPLPIGHGQTISQPYIVAYMTAMLDLKAGEKVLEIGTGSGYQAAVLSELTPHVFTIEIIRPLGEQAREKFDNLGYQTIKSKINDGYFGWEKHAPFDAIIVTAAAGHVPTTLIQQLKPGGVMAIPLGSPYETQTLMKVSKSRNGEIRTHRLIPVRFVPMTGTVQEQ